MAGWRHGGEPSEAKGVKGPEVVVAEAFPEEFRGYGFAVVHCAFAWVVTYDAVYHYCFFAGEALLDFVSGKNGSEICGEEELTVE